MKFRVYLKAAILLSLLSALSAPSFAQRKGKELDTQNVTGLVKDSVSKNILVNANVAIYNVEKGDFLLSTRTDQKGSFIIEQLPINIRLVLKITSKGYSSYQNSFLLQAGNKANNFGTVLLSNIQNNEATDKIKLLDNKISGLPLHGVIIGKVKDSTYKHVLSSATVSVYNNLDSTLLQFTMPNNFGEFKIQNLPVNIPLKLLVTHVGYTPHKKIFQLETDKDTLDFNWIYMHQNTDRENTLEEVKITSYAPVRMNGDTLEFNPRAFKLDVNATTEDLMRRLPGMVIWGDGDITFNGKKINSLLVDGKPFMGGTDFTTATQNLPKDVLDKVQIYSQRNDKNPLDSTLNANLKLKEDKKMGYFGKVAMGYGTTKRFATDAMLSGYNKKLQISAAGAINNVNKSANNINTLIKSSSYKGEGNSTDYQSDFRKAGINTATTAGTRFQYDFIPDVGYKESRRLTGDYLFKQNNETINGTQITNTILKSDSILSNQSISQSTNRSSNNSFLVSYVQQSKSYNFTVSADANINQSNNSSESNGGQTLTGIIGQLSKSTNLNSSRYNQKKVSLDAQFNYQKEFFYDDKTKKKKHLLANFTLGYRLDYQESIGDRHNLSSISSTLNPSANKLFDRLYQSNSSSNGHIFNIGYPHLKKLIFGFSNLSEINLDLSSNFIFNQNKANDVIFDRNINSQQYAKNNYLTNNRIENIQDIQPKLTISKNFYKVLTNRYDKSFDINLIPKIQYYSVHSLAAQQVQNFNYQYCKFIPNASLRHNNHQYGNYELSSSLNYSTQVNYPTVEDIAPLVDSAKVWYIPKGNLNIRPEYVNMLSLNITLQSRRPQNPYQIEFKIDGNFTDDKISDSTFYDSLGRRINYSVNLNGNKYWHLGGYYRKAYSPNKKNTFRLNIWYNRYEFFIPQYLDGFLITSNNRNNNFDIEIAYSFLDKVNVNAKQGFSFYKNLQSGNNQQYEGLNNYTRFSGTLQFPKNLTWGTNINFNTNRADNQATVNYTIWNASITYRFTQGNRGEVKFAALDLLRQNKAVINNTNRNVQTFGFNNVLQQYFMVSLAYYPRKFGKKKSNSNEE